MIKILRIKAVSVCLGIRRVNVVYLKYNDRKIDLTGFEHPLKSFKELTIMDEEVAYFEDSKRLILGEEVYFSKDEMVKSLDKDVLERKTIGIMLMPLAEEMVPFYENQINEGYVFDQYNGEFEFIIGAYYSLINNENKKNEWFNKAKAKGYPFELLLS